MRDDEIDEIVNKAVPAPQSPRPEVLQRARASIAASLRPVRPMPADWVLTGALVLVCAAVSLAGAFHVGLFGFEKMDLVQRGLVFPVLGILLWATARTMVAEMIPGSRRSLTPGVLVVLCCVGLAGLFASLFRDPGMDQFVSIGIGCLTAGLLHAIPATLLSWFVVRRGFALNAVSAGLVAGMLGGLAGVGMLELHCPNFETAHLLVWHLAVVPLSGALAALVGWIARGLVRTGA